MIRSVKKKRRGGVLRGTTPEASSEEAEGASDGLTFFCGLVGAGAGDAVGGEPKSARGRST